MSFFVVRSIKHREEEKKKNVTRKEKKNKGEKNEILMDENERKQVKERKTGSVRISESFTNKWLPPIFFPFLSFAFFPYPNLFRLIFFRKGRTGSGGKKIIFFLF